MSKIKNFFLNLWYGLPFGMKGAGDEIMGAGSSIDNDVTVSQEVKDNRVAKHLLKGEVTQEVEELRYRTYKVSNESEKYKYLGNGVAFKDVEGDKYPGSDWVDKIKFSQENGLICSSVLDELKRVNDYGVDKYRLEIVYDGVVKFKLEQFATKIDVMIDSTGKEKIIETKLHFEKQTNPYNPKSKPFVNELSRIASKGISEAARSEICTSMINLSFTTYKAVGEADFTNYCFVDKARLKSFEETDFEFIITFEWDGYIRLPLNVESKYYSKEMDRKYKENERKDVAVEVIDGERKAYCSICGKEMSVYDADILKADGKSIICNECYRKSLINNGN